MAFLAKVIAITLILLGRVNNTTIVKCDFMYMENEYEFVLLLLF